MSFKIRHATGTMPVLLLNSLTSNFTECIKKILHVTKYSLLQVRSVISDDLIIRQKFMLYVFYFHFRNVRYIAAILMLRIFTRKYFF